MGGCVNPFAPTLDKNLNPDGSIISDQKSIEGVFQNFQNSYTFADTTIYGGLLAPDFVFSFKNYDLGGVDVSWEREEEMKTTYGLFENTQRLDLVWNNIVAVNSDSTNIIRSFNLTITFNPTSIAFIDGKVNLSLRKNENEKWQITRWVDESNF
ncbi:MAG: hypothetical protein HND52_11915 [Ignavibacteriae bacterium]|nr:hypothetical protein [Ignavibacteriota bacterium]NOG98657.1 hypothetical protein [Ignavibacteriota bacterium]